MNINSPRLHGIQKRKGRPPKRLTYSYDQSADAVFTMCGRLLKEAQDKDFNTQLRVATAFLPLSLKRIPDKQEVLNVNLNAQIKPEEVQLLIDLAARNLLLYNELRKEIGNDKQTSENISYVKQEIVETD
jgi:hypothetical protein